MDEASLPTLALPPAPAITTTSPPAPLTRADNPRCPTLPVLGAWPRSAQVTTAFLLGVAITALGLHVLGYLRWGSRPTDLERGAVPVYRVDLNRADHAALLQLPGVGENLATRIEQRRSTHGPYRKVDDLRAVKGVGPATLDRLRDWVEVDAEDVDRDARDTDKPASRESNAAGNMADLATKKSGASKKTTPSAPIDINRASADELQKLPDIGPAFALRIIEEREKRPFERIEDLRRVPGIKEKRLESLRPHITVQGPSGKKEPAP
jgi:competence ComEA-like helix-hairpin-helix protein